MPGDIERDDDDIESADVTGESSGDVDIIPPEQPPMDDAAGGPQADDSEALDDTSTDDLSVQGGE